VDEGVPEPDRDSGSVRCSWLLRVLLAHRYDVTFLPHVARPETYSQQLRFHGVRVLPPTQADQMVLKGGATASAAAGSATASGGGCLYDGYILSRPDVFQAYAPAIRSACPSAPLVYDTVDVHFLREARAALSQGGCLPCQEAWFQQVCDSLHLRTSWCSAATLQLIGTGLHIHHGHTG
jgi:hypothetical protein